MISEANLKQHLCDAKVAVLEFAERRWLLDHTGVVFVPKEDALLVSDLHFEKASYLNKQGNTLPELDTLDTLNRLEDIIDLYQPKKLITMGDNFHDLDAGSRVALDNKEKLSELTGRVEQCIWLTGNHDNDLPAWLSGDIKEQEKIDDVLLVHEPIANDCPQIFGHFHPKHRVTLGHRKVSGKCFVNNHNKLIMPSFGTFTGGLFIDDNAIKSLMGKKPTVHFIYQGTIVKI